MAVRFVLLLCLGLASAAEVTPIQKVLQLMNDMLVKGRAEKEEEAVKFSAFAQWCGDQTRIKNDEIAAGNQRMDELKATIEKDAAHIRALTDRIEELDEDVARWAKDQKSATTVREAEALDYKATSLDYSESLSALSQAIAVLKKQAYNRPQAEQALLQVQRSRIIPVSAKSALVAFLQQQPDGDFDLHDRASDATPDKQLFYDAPEANAYDFQSGGVVEMLEKLEDEFSAKKTELDKDELSNKNAYEQIMQQLVDNTENANHEISKKTELRARTEKHKADAEGDLATTTKERDADTDYLDEMTALCTQKRNDFESRQKLRAEELEAVAKAAEIIASNEVRGTGEKYLPSAVQVQARGTAFSQLRSDQQSPLQGRIAAFLAERAKLSGSRLLSEVSQRVEANPFVKVKKMIQNLISKLMEEATSETEHKGWCDTELTTNQQTRDRKTAEVNRLTAEIEDLTAEIAQLTQDIADLATAVKELDANMASATEDRSTSKTANDTTIKEAKEAQVAVEQAMAVLKDFYAKSAQATALAQQTPGEDAPETFDKEYKGMLTNGGNVVDFLEVILSDFSRLESETASAEATEQEEYEKFMFHSKKDKALKENESAHKAETKTNRESDLHSADTELKTTQEQLDKAVAYYEKLKPTCVDSGITYEERVKRRNDEIQSLQEALKILTGEDIQ
jgi:uncharacterized protein YoxC